MKGQRSARKPKKEERKKERVKMKKGDKPVSGV